ncbi:cytochrome B561, N terminal-domain-containing protein [Polychytrium aggregatum]|uniref:cytochrome B561, N terminal-domain-containing protein n=1 Tax=Polychytrium aggregatum TaxID=110093 RepID=UPI0022FEAD1E|nr:cytochrome B561, N terminal-domain-containing protein [Polychytrium aggregatum]KAI9199585.1 cytochrome B561, N terminal-domain-containing protein [Polychytrium aggregatum]
MFRSPAPLTHRLAARDVVNTPPPTESIRKNFSGPLPTPGRRPTGSKEAPLAPHFGVNLSKPLAPLAPAASTAPAGSISTVGTGNAAAPSLPSRNQSWTQPTRPSKVKSIQPWEHPAFRDITTQRYKLELNDVDLAILAYNGVAVAVLIAVRQFQIPRSLVRALIWSFVQSPKRYVWQGDMITGCILWIVFGMIVVCSINVLSVLMKIMSPLSPPLRYDLSPSEREVLGVKAPVPDREADQPLIKINPPSKEKSPKKPTAAATGKPNEPLTFKPSAPQVARPSLSLQPRSQSPNKPAVPEALAAEPPAEILKAKKLYGSGAFHTEEPIRDQTTLSKLFSESENVVAAAAISPPPVPLPVTRGQFGIPKFQTATKSLVNPTSSKANMKATDPNASDADARGQPSLAKIIRNHSDIRIENGMQYAEPEIILDKLNLNEYMDEWRDRMRKWLAVKVVEPLAKRIQDCDDLFKKENVAHLDCRSAVFTLDTAVAPAPPVASTFSGATGIFAKPGASTFGLGQVAPAASAQPPNMSLHDLFQRHGNLPQVKERRILESYLNVPGTDASNRRYIVERIIALGKGGCLSTYNWLHGMKFNNKGFTSAMGPCDALLLMHLFCQYMNENINWSESGASQGAVFTQQYFVPSLEAPIDPTRSIQIRQTNKYPPHFQLIVENMIWDIHSKRNNLLDTLCIFAHYINVTSAGYLGMLNLGGKSIDMMQVVQDGPLISHHLQDSASGPAGERSTASATDRNRPFAMVPVARPDQDEEVAPFGWSMMHRSTRVRVPGLNARRS